MAVSESFSPQLRYSWEFLVGPMIRIALTMTAYPGSEGYLNLLALFLFTLLELPRPEQMLHPPPCCKSRNYPGEFLHGNPINSFGKEFLLIK
jgi:hypothetical protein